MSSLTDPLSTSGTPLIETGVLPSAGSQPAQSEQDLRIQDLRIQDVAQEAHEQLAMEATAVSPKPGKRELSQAQIAEMNRRERECAGLRNWKEDQLQKANQEVTLFGLCSNRSVNFLTVPPPPIVSLPLEAYEPKFVSREKYNSICNERVSTVMDYMLDELYRLRTSDAAQAQLRQQEIDRRAAELRDLEDQQKRCASCLELDTLPSSPIIKKKRTSLSEIINRTVVVSPEDQARAENKAQHRALGERIAELQATPIPDHIEPDAHFAFEIKRSFDKSAIKVTQQRRERLVAELTFVQQDVATDIGTRRMRARHLLSNCFIDCISYDITSKATQKCLSQMADFLGENSNKAAQLTADEKAEIKKKIASDKQDVQKQLDDYDHALQEKSTAERTFLRYHPEFHDLLYNPKQPAPVGAA